MLSFLMSIYFWCLILQGTFANNCGDLDNLLTSESPQPWAGYFWSSCNDHCVPKCDEHFLEDMISKCSNIFPHQYSPCIEAAYAYLDKISQPPSPQKAFDGKFIEVDPIVPDENRDPGSDRRKLCARYKNTGTQDARFTLALDAYTFSDPTKTYKTISSTGKGWDILAGQVDELCVFIGVSADDYNLEDYWLKLTVIIDADQGMFEVVDQCKKSECLKI